MSQVLAAPFLAAAGLLVVSGAAKLRHPFAAVPALALLGLPARRGVVRLIAAGELALGAVALAAPGRVPAVLLALAYAGFALVAARLAAERAACGCFGESDAAASPVQVALSAALAAVAVLAAIAPPDGLGWIAGRPVASALTLALAISGGVYGLVIAYTQLPAAWGAWSAP